MKKSFLPLVLLSAFGLAFSGPYDTWTKYRNVTVDGSAAGITGTVTGFPLLVRLTNASEATGANVLSEAKAAGADIRFTTADGNTALAYQIERWTSTAAEIWVKVPSITAPSTSVRLYWGKSSAVDSSVATSVFDTAAGFRAVWHMNTAGNQVDVTANGLVATVGATAPTDTATGLGVGKRFNDRSVATTNGYVVANHPATGVTAGTGAYTLSAWANPVTCSFSGGSNVNRMMIMGRMNKAGRGQYAMMTPAANGLWQHRINTVNPGGAAGSQWSHYNKISAGANTCTANAWQYLSVSFSGTAADSTALFGYLNGALMDSNKVSGSGVWTDSTFTIGKATNDIGTAADSAFRFRGGIDEVRISSGVRSADWHRLDYQTQRPDSAKVILGTTQTVGGPVSPWANWLYSRPIKLNTGVTGANVVGTVTNFPVLVRLGDAEATIFTQAKAAGADIRFSKSNDSSLPYQIERWNATAKRAEIWVKVDSVKGNDSAQSIKMYWGNSAVTSLSNGTAVFDTLNGFASVWHLGDTTGVAPRPNSIAGRFAATPVSFAAGYQPREGIIGLADSLSGGSNADSTTFLKINEGTASTYYNFPGGKFSYSAWIKITTVENFARWISLNSADAGTDRIFFTTSGGNIVGRVWANAGSQPINSTTPATVGVWSHVAMTTLRATDSARDTTRLYLDGIQIAQATHALMPNVARNFVRIGKDYINVGQDRTYDGKIDEAQLSHVTRSADFVKLSYESQRTFQKFSNIGLGVVTPPDAPTGANATAGAPSSGIATVSWTAPGYNGGAAITSYKAMAMPDSAKFCTTAGLTCDITGLANVTSYTFVVRAVNSAGSSAPSAASNAISIPVGIAPGAFPIHVTGASRPYSFRLSQNEMVATEALTLSISDLHGRTVWSRTVNPARDNVREISWNGRASNGRQASAGMYLVKISVVSGGKTTDFEQKAISVKPVK